MAEPIPEDVTLSTLHGDLKGEMRGGFSDLKVGIADLKVTLVAGFRNMPTRQDSQEMIHLLRERFRILARRPSQRDALDSRIQEQSLELQQVLHALAEETQGFKDRDDDGTKA